MDKNSANENGSKKPNDSTSDSLSANGDMGWSPMLELDAGFDSKLHLLDLDRKDHRYLHGLTERIKGIESHWLALLEKNFAPEVMLQFSHLIRDESRLAEAHGFNSVYELTTEIDGTLLALGRSPGNYTDSIRSYIDSCVSALHKTVTNLIDDAVASQPADPQATVCRDSQPQAPRIYVLDTQKETASELAVDLKGQGFKVFSLVDWGELERLCRLQKPQANLVVLNENENPQTFLENLRRIVSLADGSVPCYVLSHEDNAANRVMVASSGANSFVALPCFTPTLAAELHGLTVVSLTNQMKLLLVGDPKAESVKQVARKFVNDDLRLIACEKLSQLPYIAREQQVDGLLVVDTGDEKLLTRCIALVGQDHFLAEMPMTVILRTNHGYPEPMLRLVSVAASDVYQETFDKPLLLMRSQSRTLQYRRKRFYESYMEGIDRESGLMLRQSFYQEVERRAQKQRHRAVPCAITYLRLDFLREVSEALGVSEIGSLRKSIAHRLISVLAPDDLVTTLSDNEYLIFSCREEASAYRQIEWSVKKQIEQYGLEVMQQSKLVARVGIALMKDMDVLKAVNTAIGSISIQQNVPAKPAPQKVPEVASAPILTKRPSKEVGSLSLRLKQAVDEDRLSLLFQPIVSMEGDGFERYEVLMRLKEGDDLISPTAFLTKEAPVNVKRFLDRWVINKSLRLMANVFRERKELKFFIKLNPETIVDKGFIDWLTKVFEVTNAPVERCVFELREQCVIDNFAESQAFVTFVHEQGACICIENFGGKQQSLKLLDYIDVDYLKLEKGYLEAIGTHDERDLRLDSIIEKANQMEVSTLASFVETTSNLSLGLQRGVALFQGYFLQPPNDELDFDFSMSM